MSAGPLIFDILAALILAAAILYRYGDWYRHHIIVTLAVLVAWCFSFLIIFVLPLDVSSTVYRHCRFNGSEPVNQEITDRNSTCLPPWSYVPDSTFPSLWRVVYWTSQFLTWFIMPLMQSYTQAGDFTVAGKLRSAAIDNAIYYGTYLLIAGILLIYIASKGVALDWQKLKAIASSASNTWGLFLLVLLLGHALVEVPRGLWNNSKNEYALRYSYFKVSKVSGEMCEAEEEVNDLLESLKVVVDAVRPSHPLYAYVDVIIQLIPIELRDKVPARPEGGSGNASDIPSEKTLVRIHKQLKKALQKLHRTQAQWNIVIKQTVDLEDIQRNTLSHNKRFKATFPLPRNAVINAVWHPTLEWYYKCILHVWILRFLAVVTGILSIAVVWSEVTFFKETPVLSLFARLLDVTISNYDYLTMELTSTAIIGYLCYCAYSTVLKIKFLNKYYIAPNHQTDEFSLIFSGMMLCRLTPPMCLNFLGLIHMDNHIIKSQFLETGYTRIMGHMDVISIISDGFNIYFPMLMLLFCLASYFLLGSRLLSSIGFQQFIGDELTENLVEDGKGHVEREKKLRLRLEEIEQSRRHMRNLGGGGVSIATSNRGRDRQQRANNRDRDRDDSREALLSDSSRIDHYVSPSPLDATRDRVGRLPKDFFDDV